MVYVLRQDNITTWLFILLLGVFMQWLKLHISDFPITLTNAQAGALTKLMMHTAIRERVPNERTMVKIVSSRGLSSLQLALSCDSTSVELLLNSVLDDIQVSTKSRSANAKRQQKYRDSQNSNALRNNENNGLDKTRLDKTRLEESKGVTPPPSEATFKSQFYLDDLYNDFCEKTELSPKKSEALHLIKIKINKIVGDDDYACSTVEEARDMLFEIHKVAQAKKQENVAVNVSLEKIYALRFPERFNELYSTLTDNKFVGEGGWANEDPSNWQ